VYPGQRYLSPLRYPGGKAALAPFIAHVLAENGLGGCSYYEPFAGGAGAALKLLQTGLVSDIHLNDADVRLFALWKTILNESERFAEAVSASSVSIPEWRKQLKICTNPRGYSHFQIAYATFYLNRCNRSGVILGSRPIGGMSQNGPYTMAARFNRLALATRLRTLGAYRGAVTIHNLDALDFVKSYVPKGRSRSQVFVYLDPPYFNKGSRLYLNYYSTREHVAMARYLQSQIRLHWLVSYDDEPFIAELYAPMVRAKIRVDYSLQARRQSSELIIAPPILKLPSALRAFI
jgi:DNA adenine methylase